MTTPVSDALTAELQDHLRRHGLLVWLDKDGHYTDYVGRIAADPGFGAPVVRFAGSYLEVLAALDGAMDGVDPPRLLLHLPGFNEQTLREGPLLEVFRAGTRYRKALDSLVREAASGRVEPDKIAAFLAAGEPSLGRADAWMAEAMIQLEGGLNAQLEVLSLPMLLDDLLGEGAPVAPLQSPADLAALWGHLRRKTGMDEDWRRLMPRAHSPREQRQAAGVALAGWALTVELVHDLEREPRLALLKPLRELDAGLVETCRRLAQHLRVHRPDAYERMADEFEGLVREELAAGDPAELGRMDTFRLEEARVFAAALRLLDEERWDLAADWASVRLERSFWVGRDPSRRSAWRLVADAARLGQAIAAAGPRALQGAQSLEEAVERYVSAGAAVDRAHRELEQRHAALFDTRLPAFGALQAQLEHLRLCYGTWADHLARDFNALCARAGYVGPLSLQQRAFFEQDLQPLLREPGRVALFLVDALRFEMAAALAEALREERGAQVTLRPRLAELPTETAVGMNALPPTHQAGRLTPLIEGGRFAGFQTAAFQVRTPEQRKRVFASRVEGRACPWVSLGDALEQTPEGLRRAIAAARLLIVHSLEIDAAGEKGVGLAAFEDALRKLRVACQLLREAGVRRFVFTSDHGFLLNDPGQKPLDFGTAQTPTRRYVVRQAAERPPGTITVPLSALGYEGAAGYLVLPEDTREFNTGAGRVRFSHGGNALQERVIPVLTAAYKRDPGGDVLRYTVSAEVGRGVADMSCLAVRVSLDSGQSAPLGFSGQDTVELALRVPERDDITVELCDLHGPPQAAIRAGALRLPPGEEAQVFFKLRGAAEERAALEVFSSTDDENVRGTLLTALFPVQAAWTPPRPPLPAAAADLPAAGAPSLGEPPAPAPPPTEAPAPAAAPPEPPAAAAPPRAPAAAAQPAWLAALPDEETRLVFQHLALHGSLTEAEATRLLGGPRQFRKFNRHFEDHASRVPFRARVEQTPAGKRYVRE